MRTVGLITQWACLVLTGAAAFALEGAERCLPCHAELVRSFAKTPMANSLGRAPALMEGSFFRGRSKTRFRIINDERGMRHRMERSGRAVEYPVEYAIGSGHEGRSFLVFRNGFLFQSPVAYYARKKVWDLSPGYHEDPAPDFTRPVSAECLFCHTTSVRAVGAGQNRYESPPFDELGIRCERCHGDSSRHSADPSTGPILNPAKLPGRARDSVCEQCHLGGEARIVHPGKRLWDFRPGQDLEEVLTVFVRDAAQPEFRVVSHSEQLARSRCAQQSGGALWCGTCHDPHRVPSDAKAYYRNRCHQCHQQLSTAHPPQQEDCAGCHMPRRPASDSAHTAFTDHRIQRSPQPMTGTSAERLRAWRPAQGSLATRNLGLAYISAGERDQSAFQLNEGFRLLSGVQREFAGDNDVSNALALVLLRKKVPEAAARLFAQVARQAPDDGRRWWNLAVAQEASGNEEDAVANLERAIRLDPSIAEAYGLLARLYEKRGERGKAAGVRRRYDEFFGALR